MTKLFELYVFKKLREDFPYKREITYHKKFHGLEPYYLLNSKRNIKKWYTLPNYEIIGYAFLDGWV